MAGHSFDMREVLMDGKLAADLYLELIKRVLTNTLFEGEPNTDQESELHFVQGFIQHYINGPAITMLPIARMDNLRTCVEDVIARGVPGDLIETGVWRGGATIFMRAVLRAHGAMDRNVWVAELLRGTAGARRGKISDRSQGASGRGDA